MVPCQPLTFCHSAGGAGGAAGVEAGAPDLFAAGAACLFAGALRPFAGARFVVVFFAGVDPLEDFDGFASTRSFSVSPRAFASSSLSWITVGIEPRRPCAWTLYRFRFVTSAPLFSLTGRSTGATVDGPPQLR